jgi:hypothetical protein
MWYRGITQPFLTSALDRGEWSASRLGRFNPGERAPGIHFIGGWMGSKAGLDAMEKRKISCFCRESNRGCRACNIVAVPTELSRLLNLLGKQ